MIAFLLVLILAAFGSLVAQHFIPPLEFLNGARVFLMPMVLFYGALALPFGGMLMLAFACGFMWDALTVQIVSTASGAPPMVEIALGWSIILYALLGALISGFRPLFQRGRWEIHCLMSGLCTSLIVLSEFLSLSVRRAALFGAPFVFTPEIWWRIGGAGLVAFVLAPVGFLVLSTLAALVGYNPCRPSRDEEEI
jgi:hypothetical protein